MKRSIFVVLFIIVPIMAAIFGVRNGVIVSGTHNGEEDGYLLGSYDGYVDGYRKGYDVDSFSEMVDRLPETFGYSTIERKIVTLEALQRFLHEDNTDSLKWSNGFNCLGYAFTLKANADKKGIVCGVATIYFTKEISENNKIWRANASNVTMVQNDIGHAVNAFYVRLPKEVMKSTIDGSIVYTTDERDAIVFVEPQTDYIAMYLIEGEPFYDQMRKVSSLERFLYPDVFLRDDILDEVNIFWGYPYRNQIGYK